MLNHSDDAKDEMDSGDTQLPNHIFNEAFEASADGCISVADRGVTLEDEAIAAEYLRVLADHIQAEYGHRFDAVMNELNWTLARDALLAEVRRILGSLLSQVSDVWTQVTLSRHPHA